MDDEDNKKDINHPENQSKINRFFKEFAPFINMHIRKLRNAGKIPPHIEDDDLQYAGFEGLMDAVHKYQKVNPTDSFLGYAGQRVAGVIGDYADKQHKIPKHFRTQAKNLKALAAQQPQPEASTTEVSEPETPDLPPTPDQED